MRTFVIFCFGLGIYRTITRSLHLTTKRFPTEGFSRNELALYAVLSALWTIWAGFLLIRGAK